MDQKGALALAQALISALTNQSTGAHDIIVRSSRYVTVELASAMTGYSNKAIERKCEDGVWVEGVVWIKAPDGRKLIAIEEYEKWAEKGKVLKIAGRVSASTSRTTAKSAKKPSRVLEESLSPSREQISSTPIDLSQTSGRLSSEGASTTRSSSPTPPEQAAA